MKTCPTCGTTYPDDASVCALDRTSLIAHESDTLIGTTIADRYRVLRLLGQGGMGRVYQAEHVMMGRPSAIKVMNPSLSQDPEALGRFNREASSAARISHPNVCAIYDFGPTPGGPIYLAMEYIDGVTLRAILEKERVLPLARAVELTRQCAEGLRAAHDLGIVHRDLKPDNIMVVPGRSETVKLVDFGVAKAFGGGPKGDEVTRTGFVVGTPEYMSPEQLSGDPVDGRTDIYALAIVFYRMVTSRHPFEADTAQGMLARRLTEAPTTLARARPEMPFPPELQAVLDKAFAPRAADRFQTASAFSDALAQATGSAPTEVSRHLGEAEETVKMARGRSVPTIPPTRIEADGSPTGLPKRLMPIVGLVVVGAVAGGFYFLRGPEVEPPPSQEAGAGAGGGAVDDSLPLAATVDRPAGESAVVGGPGSRGEGDAPAPPVPPEADGEPSQQIGSELEALQDSIILFPVRRAEFRARAEAIYQRRNLPDSLRVTAAWTVAQAFQEERADSQALLWFRSAYDLVPTDNLERRERLQLMIDQLQPSNP